MTCLEEIDFADINAREPGNEKTKTHPVKAAANKAKAAAKPVPRKTPDREDREAQHMDHASSPVQQPAASNDRPPDQPRMSEAQKRAIYNLSRRRGISVEELERMALDAYATELEHLSSKDASAFIRNLQQAA